MHFPDSGNRGQYLEYDLLSGAGLKGRWVPTFLSSQNSWKILSGKWDVEESSKALRLKEAKVKTGENIVTTGSGNWRDYNFRTRFRMLSNSIAPPEGGTIIYYLFSDINNYYSVHVCIFKQKVELIKRYKGVWTTISGHDCAFDTDKEYEVEISTSSGIHRCLLAGKLYIEGRDSDILSGCVGLGSKYCDVVFTHASICVPSEYSGELKR